MMLKRIVGTFFVRGLVAVLNLLTLLFTARTLGSTVLGDISLLILNISLVQIVNEIYTGSALVHFIPQLNLLKAYKKGLLWTLLSVCGVNLILYLFRIGKPELAIHVLSLSFILILHSFHMVILLAKEKIRVYNTLYLLQAVTLLSVLAVVVYGRGERVVGAYLSALYAAYSLALLCSTFMVWKLFKEEPPKQDIPLRQVLAKGLTNQIGNLAHTLSNRFNYYVIGASAWLGVYANATSLIESIWLISGSAAPIVLSHMANRGRGQDQARLVLYIAKLCLVLSFLCTLIIYFLPNQLFTAVLGEDFADTKSLMMYLAPGVLAISFSTLISHYFSGLGQQRVQLLANSLGLLCTLCLSALLIGKYGLKGACLTATVPYSVQALILVIAFMREPEISFKNLISLSK